jgi:hypothetical protein
MYTRTADTYGMLRCIPGPGAVPCACETGHGGPCHLAIPPPIIRPIPTPEPVPIRPPDWNLVYMLPWLIPSMKDIGGTGLRTGGRGGRGGGVGLG